FELVMRRHNRRLFRVARAITRSDSEAEDVVQEAYVSAYAHLADFAGNAAFATWLTRICVHEALRRKRKNARIESADERTESILGEGSMSFADETPDPEARAWSRELGALLETAIDGLPETFRVVFVMRAVEQLSVAETAACLEIPEETVKTRF